jgi:methylated-DNA-[protein]-cysteine S-methyltransferase
VRFEQHAHLAPLAPGSRRDEHAAPLVEAKRQLAAYFAGELRAFALPLAPHGSEFQRKVWAALAEIPFGATSSYGALARRLGVPSHARAIGHANGRNPLSIAPAIAWSVRTGRSRVAGGVARKRWLLAHEASLAGSETR